jgi:hypothetical protein
MSQLKVYFFLAPTSGRIKIGASADVARRWYELSTNCPEEIVYLGSILDPGGLEITLHHKFEKFRVRKEWFTADSSICEYITAHSFKEDIQPSHKPDHFRSAVREERRVKIKEARLEYREQEKVLHALLYKLGEEHIQYHRGGLRGIEDNSRGIRDLKRQIEEQRIKLDEIRIRGVISPRVIKSLNKVLIASPIIHGDRETLVFNPEWRKRATSYSTAVDNDLKQGADFRI